MSGLTPTPPRGWQRVLGGALRLLLVVAGGAAMTAVCAVFFVPALAGALVAHYRRRPLLPTCCVGTRARATAAAAQRPVRSRAAATGNTRISV